MQHLQVHNQSFRFDSGDIGPIMEVGIGYEKGGHSFLSGRTNARGIYIHVTPVKIEEHEYNGKTSKSRTLEIGGNNSGLKALLVPLARNSHKQVETIAHKLDPIVPEIAKLAWTDKRAALMLARQHLGI